MLPKRLEEYDKYAAESGEYMSLKREYIRLSLRFWLSAKNNYEACGNSKFIPILYFYSKDCNDCITQGEKFDEFNALMKKGNWTVLVFPIDGDFQEDTISLLKRFYNITKYPAVVINRKIREGQVLSSNDMLTLLR